MSKFKDLTGQLFGELTVLGRAENGKHGNVRYLCLCSCGNKIIVESSTLKKGARKTCGHNSKISIGSKFGDLEVINEVVYPNGKVSYECKCSCGKVIRKSAFYLKTGHDKSCGCKKGGKIHGLSHSRIYKTWDDMKKRCFNPNSRNYHNYGGRGITVCEEWKNSFESFYEWAMTHGYTDALTIERINVNGNYCPENCTWIPRSEQNKNKRPKSEWTP